MEINTSIEDKEQAIQAINQLAEFFDINIKLYDTISDNKSLVKILSLSAILNSHDPNPAKKITGSTRYLYLGYKSWSNRGNRSLVGYPGTNNYNMPGHTSTVSYQGDSKEGTSANTYYYYTSSIYQDNSSSNNNKMTNLPNFYILVDRGSSNTEGTISLPTSLSKSNYSAGGSVWNGHIQITSCFLPVFEICFS